MKIPISSVLKVSIKYLSKRGDLCYYQRKIPLDLAHHYNGAANVKVNLKTTDLKQVAHKIAALNKQYELQWAALRQDGSITPASIKAAGLKLLEQFNLKPNPAHNNEHDLDWFINGLESKAVKYAGGDEEVLRDSAPDEYLTSTELEALRLLNEKPKLRLSDAVEIYFEHHSKKNDARFVTYVRRSWSKLIAAIGDKPFAEVTRADARTFVSYMLDQQVKTTTVERNANAICAVFSSVIVEEGLMMANPFLRIKIGGLGDDAKKRISLNAEQLQILREACLQRDDDIRWLISLQFDLGCRISEAAGLALDDLRIDAEIPYVIFQGHSWRSLKTVGSARQIPLTGMALWAAGRIVASATKEQLYAFPRYTDGMTCNADSASAAANKWMRGIGLDKTTHELRHTLRDRLREAGAPKVIQDAVGGWSKEDIGDSYGLGESLRMLKKWMDKL